MRKILVTCLALLILGGGLYALQSPVADPSTAAFPSFGCIGICDMACPQTCYTCCPVDGTLVCGEPYIVPCDPPFPF